MKAELFFDNVSFEQTSTQSVRVVMGEDGTFTMLLKEVGVPDIRWATIGDPILDLREAPDNLSAKVITTAVGKGEIQIQDMGRGVILWLGIEVFNSGEAVKATLEEFAPEKK